MTREPVSVKRTGPDRIELSDNSVYYHIRPLKIEEVKSKVWDVDEGYPSVRAFLDTTSRTCTD